ncbi:AarF/ABC1/UbiB kinase family protein (plasmid) [Rhizobium sp. WL3]|uniref:ABC1 kinase family protein n=1 Tax=Rhizobium sp. WL3 TaxID=2603277 RepID=UPI0011C2030C|nr:AarF/ABC1/UbiB kinase family protein [Rhizobium sp. WL3]QEE43332.1 AarF/ABC1/UbiB kinase family protein [Rhizobium sp. WL3]
MTSRRERPLPRGRLGRLAAFGQLAGGIATGMMGEGLTRLARGERPHLRDLMLTPANATRAADHLSRLRGAAMKLGQLLSLDDGAFLPPELTGILSQLRDQADAMPRRDLEMMLAGAWGSDWRRHFRDFDQQPIAAASIGQVHRACLLDGRAVAVKVQYPGVAESIASDLDTLSRLIAVSGLVPSGLDIRPHLAEAKRQLQEETDYIREAASMQSFRHLLQDDARFLVPEPIEELLHPTVLVMDYLPSQPIEGLRDEPADRRNAIVCALLDLTLKEMFDFGLMQTDPNFANFRWQRTSGRIVLLDFGATRAVSQNSALAYRRLLSAALIGERRNVIDILIAMGFISNLQVTRHGPIINSTIDTVTEHLRATPQGLIDLSDRGPLGRVREDMMVIAADRSAYSLPSPDKIFLQRKIAGLALMAMNLKAEIPLRSLLERYS